MRAAISEQGRKNIAAARRRSAAGVQAITTSHVCENCGTDFVRRKSYGGAKRYCSQQCSYANRTGANGGNWKGGRSFDKAGYAYVTRKGRHIFEHRIIAEKALGRPMKATETVHHINGDILDNDPRNLLICTNGYHRQLHARMSLRYQQQHFPTYRRE